MAWYRLIFHPRVADDLRGIEHSLAQRLFDKAKWIASNVDNLRHEPVAMIDVPGISKYAVGDWRIFYVVDRAEQFVNILAVVPRRSLSS
ncbi:MAG TPA: type II toxin-antitoxin system RelE/ParE family toxin [Nitrospira sp.]|nr:type II toxin-antitoxin system RelE/ParE family toxin [Nitrospira sp.]